MTPTPDDTPTVSYKVKFCWVGDLDGDGEFDCVVDRYNPTVAARQWLQAYKRDGTLLWQMNMGPNSIHQYSIEPGSSAISISHGDNVTVYDMDGDGKLGSRAGRPPDPHRGFGKRRQGRVCRNRLRHR